MILVIPDLHGKSLCRIEADRYRHIVFLGDYVDNLDGITRAEELNNLERIVELKLEYPDKVKLLYGNHDAHYLSHAFGHSVGRMRCSGYSNRKFRTFSTFFTRHRELFDWYFVDGNTVFSHAGLTNGWVRKCQEEYFNKFDRQADVFDALDFVIENRKEPLYMIGKGRGGYDAWGSFLWAGRRELEKDALIGWNQVVGHTATSSHEVEVVRSFSDTLLYFTDCLTIENKCNYYEYNED